MANPKCATGAEESAESKKLRERLENMACKLAENEAEEVRRREKEKRET